VHPHGVEVLDRADDHDIVGVIAHHLELVLLPTEDALLDQALVPGRLLQRPADELVKILLAERNAASRATQSETRANDCGNAGLRDHLSRFFEGGGNSGEGNRQPDAPHRLCEQLSVLGLVDGIEVRTDELDSVAIEHPRLVEMNRQIQRSLAADRRKQRIGPLPSDDLVDTLHGHGFDVRAVCGVRVGHDRRGIRVQEHDLIALLSKRLAGLGARVVELTRLADDDRTRADYEDGVDVVALRHA